MTLKPACRVPTRPDEHAHCQHAADHASRARHRRYAAASFALTASIAALVLLRRRLDPPPLDALSSASLSMAPSTALLMLAMASTACASAPGRRPAPPRRLPLAAHAAVLAISAPLCARMLFDFDLPIETWPARPI